MLTISETEIRERLFFDNPWWGSNANNSSYLDFPKRAYLQPFYDLATNLNIRRAIVLLGPRRVGKTVMLFQTIHELLKNGVSNNEVLFVSLETPVYTDMALEKFVSLFCEQFGHTKNSRLYIMFDEVQYLKDWERHLKSLVDSWPNFRFIVSGSAAAALKLKSNESGAGRFTDFFLPPLTFHEFIDFTNNNDLIAKSDNSPHYSSNEIDKLNELFLQYLNIGGYPEAVFNENISADLERFIKSDIIDKVLLRDLPQLYGIRDVQELNRLFTTLAYNTGNEITFEELSQSSGVAKTTLRRYIEYLEAAFLIRRIERVDHNAKRFQRASSFKVYLTNPSMRAALFGKPAEDDSSMGSLAETAVFSQWFHSTDMLSNLYYARWDKGEVDIVYVNSTTQKPEWCVEVKWSDRPAKNNSLLKHIISFVKKHNIVTPATVTTKTVLDSKKVSELSIDFLPTSLYAYTLGKDVLNKIMSNKAS